MNPIYRIVRPRKIHFGSLEVRRALPAVGLEAVGPWVFFDHIGPISFAPGRGIDVIPHPHINLATVTYLVEGEIVHRDSIGSVQTITPGAVNLMVAGRGVVHSERTGPELRAAGHRVNGLQLWLALPEEHEQIEPVFSHYPAERLPQAEVDGVTLRLVMGSACGLTSPVKTFSATLCLEAAMPEGAELALPENVGQRAVYPLSGSLRAAGAEIPERCLTVFNDQNGIRLSSDKGSRIVLIGGAPLGKRYMWWNFISSRAERIQQAKSAWSEDRMGSVPGETERYRLPERDPFSESGGRSFG